MKILNSIIPLLIIICLCSCDVSPKQSSDVILNDSQEETIINEEFKTNTDDSEDELYIIDSASDGFFVYSSFDDLFDSEFIDENSEYHDFSIVDLKNIIGQTKEADDWMTAYGSLYIDWDQEINIDGIIYYKIIDAPFTNSNQIYDYLENSYSSKLISDLINRRIYIDLDDGLYSRSEGYGGITQIVNNCDAYRTSGSSFIVICNLFPEDSDESDEYYAAYHLLFQNNKWVFNGICDLLLLDFSNCIFDIKIR